MTTIQVGTRISGGPYNQGIGIVTKVEQAQSSNCYVIGRGLTPVAGYVDIVWESHESKHIPANIVAGLPYRIHDGLGTPEEIAELRAKVAMHDAETKAKADEQAKARDVTRARLIAEYPYLTRCDENANSLIVACKNIRLQLARAFPGIKFTVRSSRYSGGDSINVGWTDGPTSDQVKTITDQYQGGSFDGMTDCYNYSHAVWNDLFGDAKYVFENRHYSDRMIETVMGRVARDLGGLDRMPTLEDFKSGGIWQIKQSGGCDLSREVNHALSKHTYCLTKG